MHRILRDDFYIGVVTLNQVKRPGLHQPLITTDKFERVQQHLDAHRASGERSHKHQHYLTGTLYCTCGKRMGYGRHTNRHGTRYEYFSCLSRITQHGPCPARYAAVDAVEHAVELEYHTDRASLTQDERDHVRQFVQEHIETRAQTAARESARHQRRLRELHDQQQKLVQLYYRDAISEEVLHAEQQRITEERAQAERWTRAATEDAQTILEALEEALRLLDRDAVPYATATTSQRRLLNQALFTHITIIDPDTIETAPAPLTTALLDLARPHQARDTTDGSMAQVRKMKNPGPLHQGRGSHFEEMAERAGFEPANGVQPRYSLSRRVPSATRPPLRARGGSVARPRPAPTLASRRPSGQDGGHDDDARHDAGRRRLPHAGGVRAARRLLDDLARAPRQLAPGAQAGPARRSPPSPPRSPGGEPVTMAVSRAQFEHARGGCRPASASSR